jgi:hypothetical protein
MKKFRCMPISMTLPIFFFVLSVPFFVMMGNLELFVDSKGQADPIGGLIVCCVMVLLCWVCGLYCMKNACWRVEVYSDKIVCKGLLPRDAFNLEYTKCNVGMDYHVQNGNRIWWIYMCYGSPPTFNVKSPADRMNAMKICPGYIKMMYKDEVFDALLEVLPKKQRTGLITARRCAEFETQGRII